MHCPFKLPLHDKSQIKTDTSIPEEALSQNFLEEAEALH
jgi:hypothetical protein